MQSSQTRLSANGTTHSDNATTSGGDDNPTELLHSRVVAVGSTTTMSLDPLTVDSLLSTENRERTKRLPAAEVEVKEKDGQPETPPKKKRNSNRMKVTNRKLYGGDGYPFDPQNDLLDDYDEDEDEEDEDDEEEDEEVDVTDEDEMDDSEILTRRFNLGVLQKSLLSAGNNKDVHLNNNPSSPTDSRPPQSPSPQQLDGNSRNALPLPGPPRDLVAQIVRPRFVTLSWMEPSRHPDEAISYDVFYKMTTSDR